MSLHYVPRAARAEVRPIFAEVSQPVRGVTPGPGEQVREERRDLVTGRARL
jgi:hypothetical protein